MGLAIKILLFAASLCYLLSAGYYSAHFYDKSRFQALPAKIFLLLGLGAHFVAVGIMTVLHSQFPILSLWEAINVCSLALAASYLYLEQTTKITRIGAFVVGLSACLALWGAFTWTESAVVNPRLSGLLFALHVSASIFGYAHFFLATVLSLLFLLQHMQIKSGQLGFFFERAPSLQQLDEMNYKSVLAGFISLSIGMICGGLWAREVWGDFWSWDPKQSTALGVWLIYAAFLHARYLAGWQGKRSAMLSIFGGLTMLFSFFGTHLFFKSVHHFT
jgi:cytochrome c-type biogenesis protein CcsB